MTPTTQSQAGASTGVVTVRVVTSESDWLAARTLILDYLEWADLATVVDLAAIRTANGSDVARLEEFYSPPHGRLVIASVDGRPAGLAGVAVNDDGDAEVTRLYVQPEARGRQVGAHLIEGVSAAAAALGYETLRVRAMAGAMSTAIELYRELGFHGTAPFGEHNPPGTVYLERQTAASALRR